jgi:hypothetical protein
VPGVEAGPALITALMTAQADAIQLDAEPQGSLCALYDALRNATEAVGALLGPDPASSSLLLEEAAWAADEAFPHGSAQSDALGVVLGAVSEAAEKRAA